MSRSRKFIDFLQKGVVLALNNPKHPHRYSRLIHVRAFKRKMLKESMPVIDQGKEEINPRGPFVSVVILPYLGVRYISPEYPRGNGFYFPPLSFPREKSTRDEYSVNTCMNNSSLFSTTSSTSAPDNFSLSDFMRL